MKMRHITEYLDANIQINRKTIEADDSTLYKIVRDEIEKLGNKADLNHIEVGSIKNFFYGLESGAENFLGLFEDLDFQGDVSRWDMSKAEITSAMFHGCKNFNCDISGWNLKNLKTARCMFRYCKNFDQDLSSWHLKKDVDNYYMFDGCDIEQHPNKLPKFDK